ncbi:MAG: DUF1236 domain-containing protein [Beijerinckiaceae bacterium]|nr:DUF1236 domain-containing protein [Beijerinckiaceae bacterium]
MKQSYAFALAAILVVTPLAVQAQGLVGGAERGAAEGDRAAGPVGAVVGGAVGAAAGTVGGILGADERPRFREYALREHPHSYRYSDDFRVGAVLPTQGVEYYPVPPEYRVRPGLEYTVVNDHPVLIDARTRQIVEILD